MRSVVQRVASASVSVSGNLLCSMGPGILILLGIARGDTEDDSRWLAEKIVALRIFDDGEGLMNRTVKTMNGQITVVSQFTLIASTRKGTRPSFNDAAPADLARPLYQHFLDQLALVTGQTPLHGEFGADMKVALVNDGPVTLIVDSRTRD